MKPTPSFWTVLIHCGVLISLAFVLTGNANAAGPQFNTLYNFTGVADGGDPFSGLTFDSTGALYGTGEAGGNYDACDEGGACGVVFKLTPSSNGGNWTESAIYEFQYQDPFPPSSNLVFGPNSTLYGATAGASTALYQLSEVNGVWNLNPIYQSGAYGAVGTPILDKQGNLYTTVEFTYDAAPTFNDGMVLEFAPQPDGSWTQTTLYAFTGGNDGSGPAAGVIADSAGNLYGTTLSGGSNSQCGTVFELSPQGNGVWTETVLYAFTGSDGCNPYAGVILDRKGNLYGTTYIGGVGPCNNQCGAVFELSPPTVQGGAWTESTLHQFTNTDGANPFAGLAIDSTGALYGTTVRGGNGQCEPLGAGCGTVFELAPPSQPGGAWKHVFFSFNGLDGASPYGNVLLDQSKRVLYGTTASGGVRGYGTVFQFTR
jgi:uncharacterized repeat protein (TIGR03803 family)